MTSESVAGTTAPAAASAGLFRAASLARLASPERLDLAAAVVRPANWLILVTAAATVAATLIGSLVIAVPIKVKANGMLLSPGGVGEVYATAGGQVQSLLVQLGDRVAVGQAIATVEQPDLQQQLQQAEGELHDDQERLRDITRFQDHVTASQTAYRAQQRQNLESSAAFAKRRIGWLTERLDSQEQLVAAGYATKQTVLQTRVELGQAGEDLARYQAQLKQLEAAASTERTSHERERLDLNLRVAAAERQVAMLRERIGRVDTVVSTSAGVVAEVKVDQGAIVERGTALLSIVPETVDAIDGVHDGKGPPIPLVATLYVDPADGKRVRPGMAIEIVPSTVRREEFGFIVGRVISVAEVPATREGMLRALKNSQLVETLSAGGAPFELRAELETSPDTVSGFRWSSSTGPQSILTGGSPCHAEIVTRRETLLALLLPPFRRLLSTL